MKYFKTFVDKNSNIYSLDMVRLNFTIKSSLYPEFKKLVSYMDMHPNCFQQYFRNFKSIGYRNMWRCTIQYDDDIASFVYGTKLNNKKENENCGFIEFNPNKLADFQVFDVFYKRLYNMCSLIELVRYDCAIDVHISRDKIHMIRANKCNYEYMYCTEFKGLVINGSVTEYQGQRNKNKFTKLYDKTAESKLPYDLSRIEFTFDKKELEFLNLPEFYIYDNSINRDLDFGSLSNTQIVLIDLLRNSEYIDYYIKALDYRVREKIKPFLFDINLPIEKGLILSVRDLALNYEKSC